MSDPITPLPPGGILKQEESAAHEGYLHRVIEEADVLVNVATGGLQDETISSRLARDAVEETGIGEKVGEAGSAVLDVFQKDHGATAEAADLERAQVVVKTEQASPTIEQSQ